ncbi:hypothetical protein QOT17_023602 [Balamuthia mandrillaris]
MLRQHFAAPKSRTRTLIVLIYTVPLIFQLSGVAGLFFWKASILFTFIRSCAEGIVVAAFFNLLLSLLGGANRVLAKLTRIDPARHLASPPLGCCCFCFCPILEFSPALLRFTRIGSFQFLVVKPLTGFIVLCLVVFFTLRDLKIDAGKQTLFVLINVVGIISLMVAKWCLTILFRATRTLLQEHRSKIKFAVVVLSLILWATQAFLLTLADRFTDALYVADLFPETAPLPALWENFLLAVEVPFVLMAFFWAFPVKDSWDGHRVSKQEEGELSFEYDSMEGGRMKEREDTPLL